MQKRTEITIETESFLVISRRGDRLVLWCKYCQKNLPMLSISEAAGLVGIAEAGQLHFATSPEGRLFICPESLVPESTRENPRQEPNHSTF